jgi:transposase
MERALLECFLADGLSLERIGQLTGKHHSTVGYWIKKHGLQAAQAERFSPRGAPERQVLERLAADGATLGEIARALDRSIATIRYWLNAWEIPRTRRLLRKPSDPATAPPVIEMGCGRHGLTRFRLDSRGSYRCLLCRQERVSERRRRVKRLLVEDAGGCCILCGYDRCPAALQFHHLVPADKSFAVSRNGVTRSLAEARAEARKCALLCANCHAEVEAGYHALQVDVAHLARSRTPRGGFEPP